MEHNRLALTICLAVFAGCSSQPATTPTDGGTGTTPDATADSGGSCGDGSPGNDSGDATSVTIEQINDPSAPGHVGPGTAVALQNVVATSRKFLVSESSSGTCMWGVFLSAPGLTDAMPYTGLLATSFGSPAVVADGGTTPRCPVPQLGQPAGDAFPDDVAPGDVLNVSGTTSSYIPAACAATADAGSSNVPTVSLSNVSLASRTSTGTTPATPHVLSATDLAAFAAGGDPAWFAEWSGVLVQIQNVSVMPTGGTLLDAYGHMVLTSGLSIGDSLYYVGAAKSTDVCYAGPTYSTNSPAFTSITGFVYLDYCNWTLAPRDKCHDLNPPSADCSSVADAGTDAGADTVCED